MHSTRNPIAQVTPQRLLRLRSVLERRQPDLTVLMDNVHKPHNFSAVLRTCDAVGVLEAHGVWPRDQLKTLNHTSGGSGKWVPVRTHATLHDAVDHLHEGGYKVFAAHLSGEATDYRAFDYTQPCALLLGAELSGLDDTGLALADHHVVIPMHGMVQSLNVSVAAAVILFEAQRQRLEAGMYARSQLTEKQFQHILFEWLHPEVARYCHSHGLDYPEMNEHGELLGFVHRPTR